MKNDKHVAFDWSPNETVIHYNFPPDATEDQKRQWCMGLAEMILAAKPQMTKPRCKADRG